MTEKYIRVLSSDSIHNLNCKLFIPDCEPKAIFQAVHGMTEHLERYNDFLKELCKMGYLCVIHDNLGHGKSVNDDSELGFIAKKDGAKLLVDDVEEVYKAVKKDYKDKEHYLFGHSMGSFITRLYALKYGKHLSGYIMMGSGAATPMADMGLFLTAAISLFKGPRHISKFIDKMAFGSYNKAFKEKNGWLTTDDEVRMKYLGDKYCTFKFTVSAMNDLIRLNKESNSKKWFKGLPESLPILIVSGSKDPVGDMSKGTDKINRLLLKENRYNVTYRLYENARHEILNDFCRETVIADIIYWLDFKKLQS